MKIFYSTILEEYFATMKIGGEIYEGTGPTFTKAIQNCFHEFAEMQ